MCKTAILLSGCLLTAVGLPAMAAEPSESPSVNVDWDWLCPTGWGCRRQCWSPAPLGASVRAAMNTQIDNGTAAGLVLYRCDFCDPCSSGADKLNPHGQRRLARMAGLIQHYAFHPLVIETSERADLDAARRNYVLSVLDGLGFASPADWVVVGRPDFPMLSGEEAIQVHESMLQEARAPTAVAGGAMQPAPTPTGTGTPAQ